MIAIRQVGTVSMEKIMVGYKTKLVCCVLEDLHQSLEQVVSRPIYQKNKEEK